MCLTDRASHEYHLIVPFGSPPEPHPAISLLPHTRCTKGKNRILQHLVNILVEVGIAVDSRSSRANFPSCTGIVLYRALVHMCIIRQPDCGPKRGIASICLPLSDMF